MIAAEQGQTSIARTDQPVVLVAVDGSPAAATALPLARAVAAQLGARTGLLHVTRDPFPPGDREERLFLDQDQPSGEDLRVILNADPAAAILRAAEAPEVALVVLTTHGRTVEPGRDLGRVATAVVAGTSRPVLLVRPEAAQDGHRPEGLRLLLVPVDGTLTTARALHPATALAGRLAASIDLLYVAAPDAADAREPGSIGVPRYIDQPQHEWPHWASEAIDLIAQASRCPEHVPVRMYLALGDPAAEITRFAREHDEDAIVLVRQSRLEPGRAAVLREVLDAAPCAVLIVGA